MTVCRFYIQGNCKFGDRCRFEHPRDNQGGFRSNQPFGARQQLNFGGNASGSSTFGGGNHSNVSFASQPQHQQQPTVQEILNTISQEMETWEKSKMWPFSCFGYQKGVKSFPGLEDHSMEEVRLKAYEAQQSGSIDQYKQWLAHLVTDFNAKKQELKRPSGATKQKLVSLIDELNRILAASEKGSNENSSGNAFGRSGIANSGTTGLFGKPNIGGQPTFPSTSQKQSAFGGGTMAGSQSTFGSGQGIFGASSTGRPSVFGGSSSGNQAMIGTNPSQPQSVFGGNSANPQSVFGGASVSGQQAPFGASSAFIGGGIQATQSVFGAAPVFGSSAASSSVQTANAAASATAVFAQPSQTQPQQTGLFGKPVSSSGAFGGGPSSTGIFSQPSQASVPNQNPFGASATASNSSQTMGIQSHGGTGLFGKTFQNVAPQATVSGSHSQQPTSAAPIQAGGQLGQSTVQTVQTTSSVYTVLDQLTAEERTQFEAPKFTSGKIPTRPPPREFV